MRAGWYTLPGVNTTLRILTALSLATWFGAMLFFSMGVAPVAFATLPTRQMAGTLVNASIARLHVLGYVACGVLLLALVLRAWQERGRLAAAKAVLAGGMLALTLASGLVITPPMADIRAKMGEIDALPPDNPDRQRFDWLHQLSVGLMSVNLGAAIAVIVLDQLGSRRPTR